MIEIKLILLVIIISSIVAVITLSFVVFPNCSGERRWETYTGELKQLEIKCDLCCHVNSYFQIDNEIVSVLNCEESLRSIEWNKNYTIYCEPSWEEYAISSDFGEPNCFWSIRIDRIVCNGIEIWNE